MLRGVADAADCVRRRPRSGGDDTTPGSRRPCLSTHLAGDRAVASPVRRGVIPRRCPSALGDPPAAGAETVERPRGDGAAPGRSRQRHRR